MTNEEINNFLSAPKDERSEQQARERITAINPRGLAMRKTRSVEALEYEARQKCRDDYRREGFNNPYEKGSLQFMMYSSEAHKIHFEYEMSL